MKTITLLIGFVLLTACADHSYERMVNYCDGYGERGTSGFVDCMQEQEAQRQQFYDRMYDFGLQQMIGNQPNVAY